jgi:hypothetical protein
MIPVTFMHPPARHSSRLGQRFQLALGAAAALAAISLSPGSAQAYVVTVDDIQYDVTTFTGSYNDNISKFETAANGGVMPWYSGNLDDTLAFKFASAVASSTGSTNGDGALGPLFSYKATPGEMGSIDGIIYKIDTFQALPAGFAPGFEYTYAVATLYTAPTPAPSPLPLFGAAAAFGFSRQLRKRIKRAPAALGSALPQA